MKRILLCLIENLDSVGVERQMTRFLGRQREVVLGV